jgi:phosphate:Na+ symporter
MVENLNLLQLLSGLGTFLLGMSLLEKSLAQGAQTGVRRWLFNYTKHPLSAIFTGTAVTAFLQSSSLVTLILMAMVGANVLPLSNAVGAVLGANLGTTFTGWLVTFLGFKLPLADMALPFLGFGGLAVVFFDRYRLASFFGGILVGIGLLLLGLDLMKTAVEALPSVINFGELAGMPPFVFLLAGAALTAVIQSSSATMMITLTLLNAGLIQLSEAAAFIIGADLGTTSTSALGALRGQATRKRLAAAHIFFNIVADVAAFFLVLPLLPWMTQWWPTKDPLMQLVFFHSSFNVLGIVLFLPLLGYFTALLNRLFREAHQPVTHFIHAVPPAEPSVATIALFKEVCALQVAVMRYCFRAVDGHQHLVRYQRLKAWEGEIIQYGTQLTHPVSAQLLAIARDSVFAAKSVSDVAEDWTLAEEATARADIQDLLLLWRKRFRRRLALLRQLSTLASKSGQVDTESFSLALRSVYQAQTQALHHLAANEQVSEVQLSTLLNLNHELFNASSDLCATISALIHAKPELPQEVTAC